MMVVEPAFGPESHLSLLHCVLVTMDVLLWLFPHPRFLRSLFPYTPISSWNLPPRHRITKSLPTQCIPAIKCNFRVTRVSHLYFSNTVKWTHRPKISLNIYIFSHKAPCPQFFLSTSFWISSFSPLPFFHLCVTKFRRPNLAEQWWGPAWAGPAWILC